MKRSTLKDIAKLTGLSVSGVSRALKDHPDIAADTKEKVREVAAALNYHPNPSAQFLHSKSSKIIAVILPEVNTFTVLPAATSSPITSRARRTIWVLKPPQSPRSGGDTPAAVMPVNRDVLIKF